jgi:hypothetical protein
LTGSVWSAVRTLGEEGFGGVRQPRPRVEDGIHRALRDTK